MTRRFNVLWMVQFNLTGLQRPRRMTRYNVGEGNTYYDASENVGGDPIPDDTVLPIAFDKGDRVAVYFETKDEALEHYEALNRYREFIKSHI